MGKWWWKYKTQPKSLWRKSIKAIYGADGYLGGVSRSGCWGRIYKLNNWLGLDNIDMQSLFYEDEQWWNWGFEDDGKFSVNSLYMLIDEYNLKRNDNPTLWCKGGPKKVNILLWRCYNNHLPTRANLRRTWINISTDLCPICNQEIETDCHLFLDFSKAMDVRRSIKSWYSDFVINNNNMYKAVKDFANSTGRSKKLSKVIFLAYVWVWWRCRNDLVHQQVSKNVTSILMEVKICSFNWLKCRDRAFDYLSLELSGQRFLWVVRTPNDKVAHGAYLNAYSYNYTLDFFPKCFLERTKNRGLVVSSWAPQAHILNHGSTGGFLTHCGGFLTHCGWNSILETIVHGVPMIVWPLYAEQKMNALMLTDGLRVALRARSNGNDFVDSLEIGRVVKGLFEGEEGKDIQIRIRELNEVAANELSKDGCSYKTLDELAFTLQN